MSSWRHSACDACWLRLEPNREPIRVRAMDEKGNVVGLGYVEDDCCFCGAHHASGIYLRKSPGEIVIMGGACKHE